MPKIQRMPTNVRNLIETALQPFQIAPNQHQGGLIYGLQYSSGLKIEIHIIYRKERKFFIFQGPPFLQVSAFEEQPEMKRLKHHLTRTVDLSDKKHRAQVITEIMARFASMSRAVADTLDGGKCLTFCDDI